MVQRKMTVLQPCNCTYYLRSCSRKHSYCLRSRKNKTDVKENYIKKKKIIKQGRKENRRCLLTVVQQKKRVIAMYDRQNNDIVEEIQERQGNGSAKIFCKPESMPVEQTNESSNINDTDSSEVIGTDQRNESRNLIGISNMESVQEKNVVYRLLRSSENYRQGIRAKNASSPVSLSDHIANGSKGIESKFISCTKTIDAIKDLAGLSSRESRRWDRDVVEIDISDLNDMQIYDLSTDVGREKHLTIGTKAWRYACRFQEVVINPGNQVVIRPEYIKRIGYVNRTSFIKLN